MKRKQFLENHWNPYPQIPSDYEGWAWGKVVILKGNSVEISKGSEETLTRLLVAVEGGKDTHFGPAIPADCLEPGDIVGVCPEGRPYLLSPCLVGNVSESHKSLQGQASSWAWFLKELHGFFETQGFELGRTPYLVSSPGVDHHIHCLQVHGANSGRHWSLPTSPEIHLKKLLCQGLTKVYEIKSCFRDDAIGENHQVEFLMLEWYRAFATFEDLVGDIQKIILLLADRFEVLRDLSFQRTTVAELFLKYLDFSLSPETSIEALRELADAKQIHWAGDDSWNDMFFRLFMEFIEPRLGERGMELVLQWPAQQASLARISQDGWAQRFELYWRGVELANAYVEENDPLANFRVFSWEQQKQQQGGAAVSPLDTEFFETLRLGMPPTVGIALGLDRLFSLCLGLNDIGDGRPFPIKP